MTNDQATETLGQRLKRQDEARKQAEKRKAEEKAAKAEQDRIARIAEAKTFFDMVVSDIREAAAYDRPIRQRKIPRKFVTHEIGRGYRFFDDCGAAESGFIDWCKSENLSATYKIGHDGMGMDSWHELDIKPNV